MNPSKELSLRLRRDFETLQLPVSFARSWPLLKQKLAGNNFDFVLMLGQAGGRKCLGMEKIAVNLIDTETPDEDGEAVINRKISEHGPEAYFSNLDLRNWCKLGRERKLPIEVSHSAGLFVCNFLYYQMSKHSQIKSLFVHLPYMTEQMPGKPENTPSISLALMEDCIRFIISEFKKN